MIKVIDYYLSLNSPYAYLGSRRLEAIVQMHGAEVRVKPVNFATIFPKTGGLPLPKRAPARQAYRLVELKRWRKALNMPLNLHPKFFPAAELEAACTVIAAAETGGNPLKLAHAFLRAVWAEERNIADRSTLKALAQETGHDTPHLMARAADPRIRTRYEQLSEEALAAGVFGAPSYVLAGEIFWGQDRLDFLDRALSRG